MTNSNPQKGTENMDKELFDLCKQCYEKTGWKVPSLKPFDSSGDPYTTHYIDGVFQTYIYTSDHLLEKLPNHLILTHSNDKWHVTTDRQPTTHADTPLKSLLKLTIALHEAGELK